jgi:hypothetical protein
VFGYEAKLYLAEFCKAVTKPEASYIFDMAQMRQQVVAKGQEFLSS